MDRRVHAARLRWEGAMTAIQRSGDCGNSPKNAFIQEIAIALESGVCPENAFADNIQWFRGAAPTLDGRASVIAAIGSVAAPASITIEHAISHGKVGAANGEVRLADGRVRHFSHFFEFTSAKANLVSLIKSYLA